MLNANAIAQSIQQTVAKTKLPLNLVLPVLGIWVAWGAMYMFTRIILREWQPYFLASMRFLCAGLLLFGVARWQGAALPTRKQWAHSAVLGTMMLAFGTGSTVFAQQYSSSSLAAIIAATGSIWIALFSGFVGKLPKKFEWLGIGIGFVGTLVLASQTAMHTTSTGLLFGFLGTLFWSVGSVLSQKLSLPHGLMRTAAQMLVGGSVLFLMSRLRGEVIDLNVSWITYGAWVVAVLGSIVGYGSYMHLLGLHKTALASSYAYMNPVVALLLGMAFLNERITPTELLGMGIVLLGVLAIWLASVQNAKRLSISAQR